MQKQVILNENFSSRECALQQDDQETWECCNVRVSCITALHL